MSNGKVREGILKIIEEKDALEKEIMELNAILAKNKVGMDDPLVDSEGFPFSHIDIYQVRHARHLLIHKQNDHKNLMKQIETSLEEYYKSGELPTQLCEPKKTESPEPFAKISVVSPGSPVDEAGIRDGDQLVEFGSINASNFRVLDDIGVVVKHSLGGRVNVKVLRNGQLLRVALKPRKWEGRGLLGCNVLPI